MRIAVLGAICCLVCACETTGGETSPDILVLKSASKYAVIQGNYQQAVSIDGQQYSAATRAEALQIAVDNDLFDDLQEARATFDGRSYDFVYATISEALAIEGVYANQNELKSDILDGLSGPELKKKYLPSFRVTIVAPQ